jgi:hypothetical protein
MKPAHVLDEQNFDPEDGGDVPSKQWVTESYSSDDCYVDTVLCGPVTRFGGVRRLRPQAMFLSHMVLGRWPSKGPVFLILLSLFPMSWAIVCLHPEDGVSGYLRNVGTYHYPWRHVPDDISLLRTAAASVR